MQDTTEFRTSRDLFSNHYLNEHLPDTDAWESVDSTELQEAHEDIVDLWERERDLAPDRNESQLEEKFIRPMFRKLGIPFEVEESVEQGQRRPDYGFFQSDEAAHNAFTRRREGGDFYRNAVAVADAKRWGRKLDTRGKQQRDFQNPSYQIHVYLQETPTTWAVLTNGEYWRLYYGPTSHRLDSYYEIHLPTVLESGDLEAFKYFYLFFRHEAFLPDAGGDCFLDDVYSESNVFAEELGEDLQDNIYDAIQSLAEGFLTYPENDLGADDLELIHDSSLIYLYRLIFVLYAESEGRDLLDTDNEIYEQSYSLNTIKQEVTEELDSDNPSYQSWQDNLWDRIDELFHLIDQGSASRGIPEEDLYVPAYNGGLFRTNPDPDDSRETQFLATHTVGDEYLARVIELLTRSQTGTSGKIFVDYSSLDVRHLGSIYEGLLEYQLNVADEPPRLDDGEYEVAEEDEKPVVEPGEVYLTTDSGERKATGSYYTPEYVVEYIVENTLEPLVEDIREDLIGFDSYEDESGFAEEFAERIFELKILDPAMGSGHFLTNTIDYLAREIIDAQERQAEQQGIETVGREQDINWARRQVAQHCIYGVDLNPLAVELAKVSLWLRTLAAEQPLAFLDHHFKTGNSLVGADIESIDELETDANGGPNASLADFGAVRRGTIDHLMDVYEEFIAIENTDLADAKEMERKYREIERDDLRNRLVAMANVKTAEDFGLDLPSGAYERMARALDSNAEWVDVEATDWFQRAQAMAAEQNFLHWKLDFPEVFYNVDGTDRANPGFDAVIGNPPYIRIQELRSVNSPQADYLIKEYESAVKSFDVYVNFTEKGYDLLREGGLLGFIEPHKFFQSDFGEGLRGYLSRHNAIREVVSFGRHQVFDVSVYTCMLILEKGGREEFRYAEETPTTISHGEELEFHRITNDYTNESWVFQDPQTLRILENINNTGPALGDVTSKIYQGVVTSADDIYLIEVQEIGDETVVVENGKGDVHEIESDIVQPFLKGQDVKRYSPLNPPQSIVLPYRLQDGLEPEFIAEDTLKQRYPKAHSYFKTYEEQLRERDGGSMDTPEWYDLTRNQNMSEFAKNKIVTPEISYGSNFTYDSDHMFHKSKVYGLIPKNEWSEFEKPLLAVLNSTLLWYYLQNTGYVLRGGYFTFKTDYLSPFSVPSQQLFRESHEIGGSVADILSEKVGNEIDYREQRQSLNLSLLDYLGNYASGPDLPDIGFFQPSGSNILNATTEKYEKLSISDAKTERSGQSVTIYATARYKPEDKDEYETDQWGYTETGYFEAFTLTDLTDIEATLVEAFVPLAVEKSDGFAGFRDNATKTNTLIDRLKDIELPHSSDIADDLERYLEAKERADELDKKIEETDQLIDGIVYDLYGISEEQKEVVESTVQDD
jgi:type I restriction-modification system DNA methylase subunit